MGLDFGNELFGAGIDFGVKNRAITFSDKDLNADDFEVIDEQLNIRRGVTKTISIPPASFTTPQPFSDDILRGSLSVTAIDNGIEFTATIQLPDGATITSAVMYGDASASAETWILRRVFHDASGFDLAGANIGTADTSISGVALVNNAAESYVFVTSSLDNSDTIYGASVTYTT